MSLNDLMHFFLTCRNALRPHTVRISYDECTPPPPPPSWLHKLSCNRLSLHTSLHTTNQDGVPTFGIRLQLHADAPIQLHGSTASSPALHLGTRRQHAYQWRTHCRAFFRVFEWYLFNWQDYAQRTHQ